MTALKKCSLLAILVFGVLAEDVCLAKKKDFKGLFGSYRREKYTENEANDSDWGIDLMLSTLFPMSGLVSTTTGGAMPTTISFNTEANLYRTFGYNLMVYVNFGRYSYETRQSTGSTTGQQTQYNLFSMTISPLLMGVKYRMSRSDFVPYLGAAGGVSFVTRTASYNYANLVNTDSQTPITVQGFGGFEFFFAPGAGLRIEVGAHVMLLPAKTMDTNSSTVPSVQNAANPVALRYASGVFILF